MGFIKLLAIAISHNLSSIEEVSVSYLQEIFLKIAALNDSYSYVTTLKTVQQLYRELIANTTLDLKERPTRGFKLWGC